MKKFLYRVYDCGSDGYEYIKATSIEEAHKKIDHTYGIPPKIERIKIK